MLLIALGSARVSIMSWEFEFKVNRLGRRIRLKDWKILRDVKDWGFRMSYCEQMYDLGAHV